MGLLTAAIRCELLRLVERRIGMDIAARMRVAVRLPRPGAEGDDEL